MGRVICIQMLAHRQGICNLLILPFEDWDGVIDVQSFLFVAQVYQTNMLLVVTRISPLSVTEMDWSALFQVPKPRFLCAMRCNWSVDPAFHSAWSRRNRVEFLNGVHCSTRSNSSSRYNEISVTITPDEISTESVHALNEWKLVNRTP